MDVPARAAGVVSVRRNRIHPAWPALLLAACAAPAPPPAAGPTPLTTIVGAPSPSAPRSAPPSPPVAAPTTRDWVDLVVGDCVAAVPAVELGEVGVTMADCAAPHRAEVFLLAPIAVNDALTGVADRECAAGLGPYTGGATADLSVTYLIDSRQDRTDNNPLPSTVICLLQRADGAPLTGSARG